MRRALLVLALLVAGLAGRQAEPPADGGVSYSLAAADGLESAGALRSGPPTVGGLGLDGSASSPRKQPGRDGLA